MHPSTEGSLDSFPQEFQQGMAARAELLGDVGESAPEHWESPLGTADVHVALAALSPDAGRLEAVLERARATYRELTGIKAIWRQDAYALAGERTSFGFKDGISNPAIEGSGIPGTNPQEAPIKAGEFPWTTLGYALMWSIGSNQVSSFEWFIVGLAFVVDLGSYANGRRSRTA